MEYCGAPIFLGGNQCLDVSCSKWEASDIHITIQCQWIKYETLFALLHFLGLATCENPIHAFHENGFVIPSDPPPIGSEVSWDANSTWARAALGRSCRPSVMEPMAAFGTGVLSVETYQHISCKGPRST